MKEAVWFLLTVAATVCGYFLGRYRADSADAIDRKDNVYDFYTKRKVK